MSFLHKNFPCLLAIAFCINLNSQAITKDFKQGTDSLIQNTPKDYNSLQQVLVPFEKDTALLRYFANISSARQYFTGRSYALNKLGVFYRDFSYYNKSIRLHQQALEAAEKDRNIEFQIYSLAMLSSVYRRTEAIPSAMESALKALEFEEYLENPNDDTKRNINIAYNSIGHIYRNLGQFNRAIENFRKSIKLEEELGNILGVAINYKDIGECLEAMGELDESKANYEKSLEYNKRLGSEKISVQSNLGIAHVYVHQDKTKEAIEILDNILPEAEKLGDKKIIAEININKGWAKLQLRKIEEAQTYLNKGLNIAKRYNLLGEMESAYSFLSDLWETQDDFKKSKEFFIEAERVEERISNDRNRLYVADLLSRTAEDQKNNQIAVLERENEIVKLKLRRNQTTLVVSALILTLFTLILYILYRQYQLKNEKKMLSLEQNMLRSQMNPHFLFNSLNSIKLYIINNEKKNAVHYLNKFSKLVRKILEASSLKEIPLAEELETVELYMNIENIRFSNEINFTIEVAEGIDPHLVKIPSLILQPFLENALWHGLSPKEGDKSIVLKVDQEVKGFIQISITDNGVGRHAAERLKESKVLKRKSVGIDITKERLANFSKDYQNSFRVEIIDLYDEKNNPAGTTVVLHIPTI